MIPSSFDQNVPSVDGQPQQRRSEVRFHVPVHVEMDCGNVIKQSAVLRDISTQGVGVEHSEPLSIGQVVTCSLNESPFDSREIYRIEVLWTKKRGDGSFLSGGRILDDCESQP